MVKAEIAVMEVKGAWCVVVCEATVPGVAKGWTILQRVDAAGDNEATARAWANWWETAVTARGIAGARELFPTEAERCEWVAESWCEKFVGKTELRCASCTAPLEDEARCSKCGAHS